MPPLTDRIAAAVHGRYTVDRELGEGGMAAVYLARDIRHDRKVAIKVLHPDLAVALGGERFLAEIRTTANLQHPHILPLHDSGEADGLVYYVMPFVEGETLRARLTRERQLGIADAVRITRQVADALSYAHAHGVVHRDIKPENILLQDGHALVADFGIALAVQQAGGQRLTQTGLSLGTPQYMAPEQAMGERTVDRRADIYALGAVLYEMLTGEPPFTGASLQAVLAKVMTERPVPPSHLRDTVPQHLEDVVLKALSKLPADRFATAADFATALGHEAAASTVPAAARARPAAGRTLSLRSAGAFAAAALVAGWGIARLTNAPAQEVAPSRLSLPVPSLRRSGGGAAARQLALTPDGSAIVYVVDRPGDTRFNLHRLDAVDPQPLARGLGDLLAISGNRSAIGLASSGHLTSGPLDGGSPRFGPIVKTQHVAAHPDGSIWFTRAPFTALQRIPPGMPGDSSEVKLSALPNLRLYQIADRGRTAIMMQLRDGEALGSWFAVDLGNGDRTPLLDVPLRDLRYSDGHLVYVTGTQSLEAVPFDIKTRRVTGRNVQIAERVAVGGPGVAQFAVSETGTVAYIPQDAPSLVFVDRSGNTWLAHSEARAFHNPRFSPDGERVVLDITDNSRRDVWMLDVRDSTMSRITFDGTAHDPIWTPDGTHVSYVVRRDTVFSVCRLRASAGAVPDTLFSISRFIAFTGAWLADASALVTVVGATGTTGGTGEDIAIARNGGHGPLVPLVATPYPETAVSVSPNGRWLAFVADYSGTRQVFVRALGAEGVQIQVSQDGGEEPLWSRDSRELFYRRPSSERSELIAAQMETVPGLRVASRRVLFSMTDMAVSAPHANYDVSRDGRTFVMVRQNPAARIMIIQNLPELVRRLQRQTGPAQ